MPVVPSIFDVGKKYTNPSLLQISSTTIFDGQVFDLNLEEKVGTSQQQIEYLQRQVGNFEQHFARHPIDLMPKFFLQFHPFYSS